MDYPTINQGMYVSVDPTPSSSGGFGFVVSTNPINVKYIVENRLSQDVDEDRIHDATLTTTSRRLDTNGQPIPGLLSYNYAEYLSHADDNDNNNNNNNNNVIPPLPNLITTNYIIQQSTVYVSRNMNRNNDTNPGVQILTDGLMDVSGWLRINEGRNNNNNNNRSPPHRHLHLSDLERSKLIKLYLHFKPLIWQSTKAISHAWGINERSVRKIVTRALTTTNISADRKVRCDKGLTIISSERKRRSVMNPYNLFRKAQRIERNGEIKQQLNRDGRKFNSQNQK
jgi:hypothetical protein